MLSGTQHTCKHAGWGTEGMSLTNPCSLLVVMSIHRMRITFECGGLLPSSLLTHTRET
jgi:hypothetical protein